MRYVILFFVLFQCIQAKSQILGPYNLRCEFDFTQGVDCIQETCNDFDTLNVITDAQKGIYTNGIYRFSGEPNASYLGIDEVESLKDSSIAFELEFIADHPGFSPLIVIGNSWRELFVEIERDSIIAIRSGDQFLRTTGRIEQNKLYNLKVTTSYTPLGTTTRIFLDDQPLGFLDGQLNIRDFDTAISNTHGGNGTAFKGWWKSLKIYSTNDITLNTTSLYQPLGIHPNPVIYDWVHLGDEIQSFEKCQLMAADGQTFDLTIDSGNRINVKSLSPGVYSVLATAANEKYFGRVIIVER